MLKSTDVYSRVARALTTMVATSRMLSSRTPKPLFLLSHNAMGTLNLHTGVPAGFSRRESMHVRACMYIYVCL